MDSRIKSNRDTSTSLDKKPSSPPQVRLKKFIFYHLPHIKMSLLFMFIQQISSNQNLLTSLFSSLQFNQNNIFNPMLDMGSTRALVLLVSVFIYYFLDLFSLLYKVLVGWGFGSGMWVT